MPLIALEFLGDGGNVYINVSVVPRSARMPLASNADGFHSSGMKFGPQLFNVEIRNLLDGMSHSAYISEVGADFFYWCTSTLCEPVHYYESVI